MELVKNRQVNIWRGNEFPPTIHHVWIRNDTSLYLYDSQINQWVSFMEYPGIQVIQDKSSIKIQTGDTYFKLAASGDAISINLLDNNVISIHSDALKTINTPEYLDSDNTIINPIQWDGNKLTHLLSSVTPGTYGPKTNQSTGTFEVPNITIDATGHVVEASTQQVKVPAIVTQNPISDIDKNTYYLILSGTTNMQNIDYTVNKSQDISTSYDELSEQRVLNTPSLNVTGDSQFKGSIKLIGDNSFFEGKIKGDVQGTATPTDHASTEPKFGLGTAKTDDKPANYGHVKIIAEMSASNGGVVAPDPNYSKYYEDGVVASPAMVHQAYYLATKYSEDLFGSDFEKKNDKYNIKWFEIS